MTYKTIQDLFTQLNSEDTTTYLTLIVKINTEKLPTNKIKEHIEILNKSLTDTQLTLLKLMGFTRGDTIRFYTPYKGTDSPIKARWDSISTQPWQFKYDLDDINISDIKYISNYHITKWKKKNGTPSNRASKGTTVSFSMDEFSLAIFKGTITKPFLRTEGKNLILRVNTAYTNSQKTNTDISIRNRFYKLILDNTEYHTKAMINNIIVTPIAARDAAVYNVREDETIAIPISTYSFSNLQSYTNAASMDYWASDLTIVSDNRAELTERDIDRTATAASIMIGAYAKTGNNAYMTIAQRFLANIPDKTDIINKTKAASILHDILTKE